ncbi:M1 family metallopeptidase [Candidatus Saccharibacteria bacterium]|nr:M1 family metallopeptidase [Candidatus Saccharibacteria bacterium]
MERLIKYFVPEKYVLDIIINKFEKTIGGVVTVTGEAKNEIIKFHAVRLKITDVLINGKRSEFETDGEVLEIFNVPLGSNEIAIYYDGKLNENMEGAYLSYYEYNGKKETIVATQFESHYAREAFPCIDEPAAKAVFELLITTPTEDMVLSNTPVIHFSSGLRPSLPSTEGRLCPKGQSPRGSGANSRAAVLRNTTNQNVITGLSTTKFEPTPRMSTYLLAFVIGKFHSKTIKNAHGVEITTYCALNQELDSVDFANEIAARSLEFYDDNFGVPYPLKKLDQVALPDFEAGAMENWGLVTYRESMLLVSDAATLGAKKAVAITVAHELSHQWFGDLVTMEWWDDLWLNESFASVMEYYAVDYIHPEYKIFESFFTGDCYAALLRDAHEGVQSVHQDVKTPEEIATLFDGAIVYAKGARLMLMVIRLMGWENFCKGISDYFKKFKYRNTVGDDLWTALARYADFNPKELMHAFIDRPGYPVIRNEGDNFKKFSQKRFSLDGAMKKEEWPIPKIMEDMSGHYILDLDEDEFSERLSRFKELSLEEKLRLLIDRDLITLSGLRGAASLVPLALEFKNENAPAVWNKVASLISNLKIYFEDDSEEEKVLKKYVLGLINDKLTEIGIKTRQEDDEDIIRLRANLMALDYFAEDTERFKELVKMYEDDPKKMDAEIRDDILSAKVYLEPEIMDEYLEKYKTISDPDIKFDYLDAACLVEDEKQVAKMIRLLGDVKIVKPQDQLYLFIYLYRNQKAKAQTFSWLTKNWDFVRKTGGDKTLSDYPMLVAKLSRTEEELKKYTEFFGPMRDDPALSRAIKIGENEIRARVKLIRENRGAVYEALGIKSKK